MQSNMTPIMGLAVAVAATVFAASFGQPPLHAIVTGVVSLGLAALAILAHRRLTANGASASEIAGSAARHFGIVWAWGGLSILLIYTAVIDRPWPEWWQFILGFAVAAALSFGYAAMLARDRAAGRDDAVLVKAGRGLVLVQVIGMAAGLISMFIDGKFPRGIEHADWAGCNLFFFGALAIALISIDALRAPAPV
ncbi:hypothetical protein DLM45_09430 [Hyphomicrobium methylovorum]|uniref:hypothetical protein n=1 Tax=Hyphomicrobium methylovorum TaxID=84 RepID=UPI0015E73EF4|nr:hypothetical protein [Hyphomicrobium methylovorum]MBA2126439.1 hypothetical protein [Hyphomicrobium methylovorum]